MLGCYKNDDNDDDGGRRAGEEGGEQDESFEERVDTPAMSIGRKTLPSCLEQRTAAEPTNERP